MKGTEAVRSETIVVVFAVSRAVRSLNGAEVLALIEVTTSLGRGVIYYTTPEEGKPSLYIGGVEYDYVMTPGACDVFLAMRRIIDGALDHPSRGGTNE